MVAVHFRQLSESENRFKKCLSTFIYQLDFETGNYEYVSPYVEKMFGYMPEQIMAEGTKFMTDRIHPDDFKLEEIQSLGMTLVKTLTKQLDGKMEVTQNEWTHFQLTFPLS